MPNTLPSEILQKEFLTPLKITVYKLSKDIKVSRRTISEIIKGNRRITANVAIKLAKYFGTTPYFWLNLQIQHDIEKETLKQENILNEINE